MERIIITVEGGVIQSISNIPENVTIEVRDYDADGVAEDLQLDKESGAYYILSEYKSEKTNAIDRL